MYNVELSKSVEKFLDKLDDKTVQNFYTKIVILKSNPYTNTLDIKKLSGKLKGCFRLRISKYRFLYKIIDDKVIIYFFEADSRGDIYK